MPTYEYRCPEGHHFEVFQKMSDDPVAKCPECHAPAERQISGGSGFVLRGEGFYLTDYRSEEYKKKASAERGESPSTPAPGESGASESPQVTKPPPSDSPDSGSTSGSDGSA